MNRDDLLRTLTLLGVLVLAGCAADESVGYLHGEVVTEVPPDAEVVPASDQRIAGLEAVQEVVQQAVARDGERVTVTVEGRPVDSLADRLDDLPRYEESTTYPRGYYVEFEGQVVVVQWVVEE